MTIGLPVPPEERIAKISQHVRLWGLTFRGCVGVVSPPQLGLVLKKVRAPSLKFIE